MPLRRLWHGLLVAPLAVPAFVNSYSWASLVPGVHGFTGALLVITLSYYPLVYLPVVAMLRGLDPALEEASYSLGHSRATTFARVVLPQLRPAILGGCLLVALHLLAEFGALQMLQFPTFTTAIYDQYSSTFNGPAANMLAGVLVLCLRADPDRRAAAARSPALRPGLARRGAARRAGAARARRGRSRWRSPGVVALAVGLPTYSLVHWLRVGSSTEFPVGELASAAGTSLGLGAAAAALTVVLAMPVAWLAVRYRGLASTSSSAAPTSPTPCPASWSRWRW